MKKSCCRLLFGVKRKPLYFCWELDEASCKFFRPTIKGSNFCFYYNDSKKYISPECLNKEARKELRECIETQK